MRFNPIWTIQNYSSGLIIFPTKQINDLYIRKTNLMINITTQNTIFWTHSSTLYSHMLNQNPKIERHMPCLNPNPELYTVALCSMTQHMSTV